MNRTPLTSKGFDRLKQELHLLKTREAGSILRLPLERMVICPKTPNMMLPRKSNHVGRADPGFRKQIVYS